jgi:hypothetical protein
MLFRLLDRFFSMLNGRLLAPAQEGGSNERIHRPLAQHIARLGSALAAMDAREFAAAIGEFAVEHAEFLALGGALLLLLLLCVVCRPRTDTESDSADGPRTPGSKGALPFDVEGGESPGGGNVISAASTGDVRA